MTHPETSVVTLTVLDEKRVHVEDSNGGISATFDLSRVEEDDIDEIADSLREMGHVVEVKRP